MSLLSLLSCGDGEIKVSNFNFDDSKLETCENNDKRVFYKRNNASPESIALVVPALEDLFLESQTYEFRLNTEDRFTYRLHDDVITSNYYCQAIPPLEPATKQEYTSESGIAVLNIEVINSNIEEGKDLNSYPYTLTTHVSVYLKDISLNNGNETIIRETYNLGSIPNVLVRTINSPSQE